MIFRPLFWTVEYNCTFLVRTRHHHLHVDTSPFSGTFEGWSCLLRILFLLLNTGFLPVSAFSVARSTMTTFIISGFFALSSGRRVRTEVPRSNGTSQGVYYVHYDTTVQCSQSGPISAEIRKYSPPGECVIPDDTIAYVVAKAYVPASTQSGLVLLEAIHIAPEPGNPNSEMYQDSVPDFPFPIVFAEGTVCEEPNTEGGSVVLFALAVSDYIRGGNKKSTLQYSYFSPPYTIVSYV